MRLALLLGVLIVGCAAKATKPVESAELYVPPIGDAGAPVAPPPRRAPPEPPAKSAAQTELDECLRVMRHIVDLQMNSMNASNEVREMVYAQLATTFEGMCAQLTPAERACIVAAKTMADVTACNTSTP